MTTNSNSNSKSKNSIFLPPSQSRLVTICAHVDHGKTTLADNLIESNGIISERLAGTIRYLDSLEEEQRRGITMRASAIGLKHTYYMPPKNKNKNNKNNAKTSENIIIHLIDSPGHTDFSTEVSTSLQCCDGSLIVVDAVEGICARTHQVLREAYLHQLVPILIINKIDRLCTDLCLSSTEAYIRLRTLIESINATTAAMITISQTHNSNTNNNNNTNDMNNNNNIDDNNNNNNNNEEQLWTFEPSKGNVIFASALYGWGFTIPSLCRSLFRTKIISTIKPIILKQYMFGDFKYKPPTSKSKSKSKENNNKEEEEKILKWKQTDQNLPLFAQFALQPIWEIYEGIATAAVSCGLGSTLFSDGRIGNYYQNNNNNNTTTTTTTTTNNNNKNIAKIKSDTIGMEQVVSAMKIGGWIYNNNNNNNGTTIAVSSLNDIHNILTQASVYSEEAVLRCLLRRFRPLSTIVLDVIYEHCPSPNDASNIVRRNVLTYQIPKLLSSLSSITTKEKEDEVTKEEENVDVEEQKQKDIFHNEFQKIQLATKVCDISSSSPTVAYICKFIATDRSHVRDVGLDNNNNNNNNNSNNNNNDNNNLIMGLARVLCGTLKTNDEYYVMGPKYNVTTSFNNNNNNNNNNNRIKRRIRLYLVMGSSFVHVNEVSAGHICAILNLDDVQLKTATLCSTKYGMPIIGFEKIINNYYNIRPLVKVNVETINPLHTKRLEYGLLKLSLADSSIEITLTSKGERIIACLGELHLEQSLLDLKRIYCNTTTTTNNNNNSISTTTNNNYVNNGDSKTSNAYDNHNDSSSTTTNNNDDEIELRISDPIVEFGETTDWFYDINEHVDYQGFWERCFNTTTATTNNNNNTNSPLPPLRQCTVPPYNEEEGIEYAIHGRSRTILTGRIAAISLRVIPLSSTIYKLLYKVQNNNNNNNNVIEISKTCKEDLEIIGRALGIQQTSNNNNNNNNNNDTIANADNTNTNTTNNNDTNDNDNDDNTNTNARLILNILIDSLCSVDDNGNAIVESKSLSNGITVRGVLSENGEVYVPSKDTNDNNNNNETNNNNNNNNNNQVEPDDKQQQQQLQKKLKINVAKNNYLNVKEHIQSYGFGGTTKHQQQPLIKMSSSSSSLMNLQQQQKHNTNNECAGVKNIVEEQVNVEALRIWKNEMRGSTVAGFQMAIRAGPICEEPVRGVMVVLEGMEIALKKQRQQKQQQQQQTQQQDTSTANIDGIKDEQEQIEGVDIGHEKSTTEGITMKRINTYTSAKPLSGGMVVAALRSGIRCALLTRPTRLMESHLKLTLHSSLAGLGSLYTVLSKRRGKVLEDSMVDGTDLLLITATLPHAESFGLAPELFRKSSGEVTAPELIFSHWDRLNEDPFWIPTSLEEREDFGEILQNGHLSTGVDNTAIKYIRMVRERKGLLVDSSRTVIAAEKQRTLKR